MSPSGSMSNLRVVPESSLSHVWQPLSTESLTALHRQLSSRVAR